LALKLRLLVTLAAKSVKKDFGQVHFTGDFNIIVKLRSTDIGMGSAGRTGVGFGLGFSVRVETSNAESASRVGEYGWGGMASTHFWISPSDEIAVVVLTQYIPYSDRAERIIKPIVYKAISDSK